MRPHIKHNLVVLPLVILVRLPVLAVLFCAISLGEKAQSAFDVLSGKLPGFHRAPKVGGR